MSEQTIAEGIGKAIIKQLHEHNEENSLDDAEYIPLIKRIIEAITAHMDVRNIPESECETLKSSLLIYAKELYLELCETHAKEDEENITMSEVKEESEKYFDYIYEHEEHPY